MKNGSKVHQQPNESPVEQEWSGRFLPEKNQTLAETLDGGDLYHVMSPYPGIPVS